MLVTHDQYHETGQYNQHNIRSYSNLHELVNKQDTSFIYHFIFTCRDLAEQNNHTQCVEFLKNPEDACKRRKSTPLVVAIQLYI